MRRISGKRPSQVHVPRLAMALIAAQAVSTFLSESSFLPIRTNFGYFELTALLLVVVTVFLLDTYRLPVKWHPLIMTLGVWFLVALISLFELPQDRLAFSSRFFWISVPQAMVFFLQFVFSLTLYNLLTLEERLLTYLLRCFAISVPVIVLWVLADQIGSGGDAYVSGPFAGRSHMGIYMFGALWILLVYCYWPDIHRWERWAALPGIGLALYAIATSLRQSVYAATIVGLGGLALSFVIARGRERFQISGTLLLLAPVLAFLYFAGGQYIPQLAFFQRELDGLDSRLEEASETVETAEGQASFDALQWYGVMRAFQENPILGIGWQGFYRSEYSPLGNEIHSTPLRVLAETGMIGMAVYLLFMAIVFTRALRLFLLARKTPYQLSALVLLIAFVSETVSQWYNRMFTDRAYWMLLVVFLVFEYLLLQKVKVKAGPEARPAWRPVASLPPEPISVAEN